jgi:hypothetical protein
MPATVAEKLSWLLILLPGFISMAIVGFIIGLGELSEFQITYYSLALTLINLIIAIPIYWCIEWTIVNRTGWDAASSRIVQALFFGCIFMVSVLTGIGLGIAAERGIFFATLRSLPVTGGLNKRSSDRPLVFLLSQNTAGRLSQEGDARVSGKATEAWARISLDNGVVYEGWPEFYGIAQEETEIYLSPACIIKGERAVPIQGPGVIIREAKIEAVILLDRETSPCFQEWLG